MTLQDWRDKGEQELRLGPHPDRARRDAELLLQHVIRRERAALLARWKEVLAQEEAEIYVELLSRRAAGEPIQYILGHAEFFGLAFAVTPDVLIPRPETEHLVEAVLNIAGEMAKSHPQLRIADVGTGSGAIAVALARSLPDAQITAIEISPRALAVAKMNAQRSAVGDCIRFLRGDLLAPVANEQFEMIVSNPPYVPSGDRATLAVEVRDHEPQVALFAGIDGLDVIRRLISAAFHALTPGGLLAFEFGFGQWPAVRALLDEAGFRQIEYTPDLQEIPRVATAIRP
jgi:release factor glutamine methyltransferase